MKDTIKFMPKEQEVINLRDEICKYVSEDNAKKILDEVSEEANELIKYFEFDNVRNYIVNRIIDGNGPKQAAWKAFVMRENNRRYTNCDF